MAGYNTYVRRKVVALMKIQTKYIGEVTIEEDSIVTFEKGLPGFDKEKQFVLLPIPGTPPESFQTLQSIETPELAFVITNPYNLYNDYEFRIDQSTIDQLEIIDEEDLYIFTIVTLKSPFDQSTINLQAPIIINAKNLQGKQFILNNDKYTYKAPLNLKNHPTAGGD